MAKCIFISTKDKAKCGSESNSECPKCKKNLCSAHVALHDKQNHAPKTK